MTRRWLFIWVFFAIGIYAFALALGIILKLKLPETNPAYGLFKDLIPFIIAIPAAWLGHCFSRRISYLQHLRVLWHQINHAVQLCIQYTHIDTPNENQYQKALLEMSVVIDEIRGAFKNIGEKKGERGLYPFEEIKQIYDVVKKLGFGSLTVAQTEDARIEINQLWRRVQEPFLSEFERAEPSFPSSPYTKVANTLIHTSSGINATSKRAKNLPKIKILSALVNPGPGEVENIVLRNYENKSIALSGWTVRDRNGREMMLPDCIITSKSKQIFTIHSEISLSNRGGSIELLSEENVRIDHVKYNAEDARERGGAKLHLFGKTSFDKKASFWITQLEFTKYLTTCEN